MILTDFNLDWDAALKADEDMGDGGFTPIPDGTYTVVCKEAEAKTFSSGNPGIKMKMAVVGGPYNDRLLWTNFVWAASNPQSLGMFTKKCVAFGLAREWLAAANPSLQTIANELNGRMASAKVVTSEYQGKKSNDVKQLTPITAGMAPAVTPGTPTPLSGAAPVAPIVPTAPVVPAPPATAPPAAPATPPLPPTVPDQTVEQAGFPGTGAPTSPATAPPVLPHGVDTDEPF